MDFGHNGIMLRDLVCINPRRLAISSTASAICAAVPFAYAQEANTNHVLVDSFESGKIGALPPGWERKKSDNEIEKPYMVKQEDGNRFLAAEDNGQSVILGKNVSIDINKYPYISFRWRVHRIPTGADERAGNSGDSAAAVYVIYKKVMGLVPVTVKYVWSSTLPVGVATQRSGVGRPWIVVADSGEQELGKWRKHVFDVRQAYRDTFGSKPPRTIIGVALLSDANATSSQAFADYDDIYFLAEADAESGVQRFVEAE